MILVSYIDILDYIHDDRQCLIEGEELFNENKVKNVSVCCRDIHNLLEVSALCACSNEPNSKDCQISIEINQEDTKGISSSCSCKSDRPSKCQHVVATLIHLHRHPPRQNQRDLSEKIVSTTKNDLTVVTEEPGCRSTEHNTYRELRSKRKTTITNNSKKDDFRIVNTKRRPGTEEAIEDDPTWEKENDREEDEAFDWMQSSDDEWEPIPEKKRKRDLPLLPAKGSKEKIGKKRNRMTKAEAEKKAREFTSGLQSREDGHFLCSICDRTFPKLNELQEHIRDIHFLKKEVFSCCKCDKTFRLLRMLKAHEGSCDVNSEDNEGSVTEEVQRVEAEDEAPEAALKLEPLPFLLCEVVTATRRRPGTKEAIEDDPTWEKEDDREEDEAFDWTQSSDDEWEPIPEKKRKRDLPLLPAQGSKEKIGKKRNRMTKAEAEKKAREFTSGLQSREDGHFLCSICDRTFPKLNELHEHIRDIHFLKKEVFSCCKCDKTFRLLRMLKAHEGSCDVNSEDNEGSVTEEVQRVEAEDEAPEPAVKLEPLACLLCEVVTATRREMHDHYLSAHRGQEKDNVSVCDRCGEFRLPREHICPSQLSFQCHMCRAAPFKAGRDYWNHLIRDSKRHASASTASSRWWCGWAGCGERFPSEAELLAHARLHLPAHAPLMCSVCLLLLRNTDAKVVHTERHHAAVYECGACRRACGDREALRRHWDEHAAERPHRCDTCGWRFVTFSALQVHARKFHEGGPFSCAKCPQKFDDRTEVRVHFGAAHGRMRCPRPGCAFRCASKASLERHAALAHHRQDGELDEDGDEDVDDPAPGPAADKQAPAEQEQEQHRCGACGAVFPLWRALLAHARSAHPLAPPPTVPCPDCGKGFRSPRDMAEHRRLHTGEKPFICAECGMTFKRSQNLEHHTKGMHTNERNFVCPECGKRFISNADMQRHVRHHHLDGARTYLCPECGHKLSSLYKLKMHVQSRHTGERPHQCDLCGAGFVARSDLNKHVAGKHRKEHPYACSACPKRYQRRRDLEVHQQRHHAPAQHRCPTCGKDFDSYASMTQHARYHTTEEPFQCAKCGRRFPHRMHLGRHLCTPGIKKNHRCVSCGLSFTTSGSLKSHRERLHATEQQQPQGAEPAPPEQQAKEAETDMLQEEEEEEEEEAAAQASPPGQPLSQPEPQDAVAVQHQHKPVGSQDQQDHHDLQQAVVEQLQQHNPQTMYGPGPAGAAAPPATVKLVSLSQPPPLTSIASPSPSCSLGTGSGAGGLVLGAPIQTTADGSFHLVFVPHGAPAPAPAPGPGPDCNK
ncbi:Zinc finger protein 569 [Frankliniella fusca]|uniref:Zinc finger protein 569 n=1 Tax=Frankliniella fusca TaxID=407009 RepID=A0AAE1HUZ5_9NEOP|nr:Zinc finger protein 569 [Frankliniella fusca]